ncbi:hypothetical protein LCGC14_1956880 [marine sediment metagenome]|uniref:Uncharacterized protein n=1 Tax=marine sediment metagenome TaxID=412755 RepID=A0A0F9HU44_9ZZZZ
MDEKCEGREQRHLVLEKALFNLRDAVGMVENFLYELAPQPPCDPEEKSVIPESGQTFTDIYHNASNKINKQSDKLKTLLSDLKEVVL